MTGLADTENVSGDTIPVLTHIKGLVMLDSALHYVE